MLPFAIKTALRNLLKARQNTFIIILSLTISFSFSNILITFISYESNTDSFHENKEQLFRLFSDDPFSPGKKLRYIAGNAGQFLLDQFPEINKICEVTALNMQGDVLCSEDIQIHDQLVLAVDTTFFELFDFPILEGNGKKAISNDGIVLKEALARKLLGAPPYAGRIVDVRNGKETKSLKVTAVVKNFYENSQLKFDAIVSGHQHSGGSVFIMLNKHADPELLAEKINQNKKMPSLIGLGQSNYELEAFTSTYYNSSNVQPYDHHRNRQIIIISWVVVLLLSCTASFNFINLYVVGLLGRRKEIGVKRVFGATKTNMTISIGIEVGIYALCSIILSMMVTYYLLPYFNMSFNTQLSLSYFTYAKVLLVVIGSILILALLITFYLAIFTWKLNPIRLINDRLASKVKANRFMFSIQFFISVGLMICAFVVIRQMQFIRNKPLGFNKNLLQLHTSNNDKKAELSVLKQRLLNYPQISKAAVSSGNPISGNWVVRQALEGEKFYSPFLLTGDEDLIHTLALTILKGGNINPQDPQGKLVNQTFVRYFDMKDPIGQIIPGTEDHIVGVVNDFNSVSLKKEIPPYIISYMEDRDHLLIDISNGKLEEILPLVSNEWRQIFPDEVFDYKLIEDELLVKHEEDTYFFRMIIGFTIASLLISCFGLYGIASFTSSRRTREIGIRKVLGASITGILLILWRDYIKLIAISYVLAVPVVTYFLKSWLEEFSYRIELSWWLYAAPGLLIIMIAILTISGQSIKAATRNPVSSLQAE